MTTVVDRFIGDNGEVLIPINQNASNSANLVSEKTGVYYIAITHEIVSILQGNPMGLLLALTYPANL